jgi:riboflavin synthase
MFTGLVEEVGQIRVSQNRGDGLSLTIQASHILKDITEGDSIAVDGVCLTVEHFTAQDFSVQAVGETVSRSTLGHKSVGHAVNLERAMQASSRFGGHFVQGHVDGVGVIEAIEKRDPGYWLTVAVPDDITKFIVEKGSITLDGLSLTVAKIADSKIAVAIIPHTWGVTTLHYKKAGDKINIEVDILAKYINNFMQPYEKKNGLTLDKLSELGF